MKSLQQPQGLTLNADLPNTPARTFSLDTPLTQVALVYVPLQWNYLHTIIHISGGEGFLLVAPLTQVALEDLPIVLKLNLVRFR